jgi:hypothetical protein
MELPVSLVVSRVKNEFNYAGGIVDGALSLKNDVVSLFQLKDFLLSSTWSHPHLSSLVSPSEEANSRVEKVSNQLNFKLSSVLSFCLCSLKLRDLYVLNFLEGYVNGLEICQSFACSLEPVDLVGSLRQVLVKVEVLKPTSLLRQLRLCHL